MNQNQKPVIYDRSPKTQSFIQAALAKVIITFADGTKRVFYSRERHNPKGLDFCINELKKHVATQPSGTVEYAEIYNNATKEGITRLVNGTWR